MTKLTRTAFAAFAAVGVIAATGLVGVGSAAAADTLQTPSLEPSAQTAQLSTSGTRLPVVDGYTIALVEGWSGGTGPADDKECKAWADFINTVMRIASEDLDEGNAVGAANMAAEADRATNDAEGRGCVIY